METASKDEALTNPKRCYGSLLLGGLLAAIAGAAVVVDFRNNTEFGERVSPELGMVMGLAAVALVALPSAAAALGRWDWRLASGTLFAAALTVLAAVSAYADKQGREILERQAAADAYRVAQENSAAARRDLAEAKAELVGIAETAGVADLQAIAAHARELAKREIGDRGGRGKLAKAHEDAEAAALARIPAARAREDALARLRAAQTRLDATQAAQSAGPAEQTLFASFIAARTGRPAEDVARDLALVTTSLSIVVTLILALLAEQAVTLFKKGLGLGVAPTATSTAAPLPASPRLRAVKPRREKLHALSDEELLARFAGETYARKQALTGAEVYEQFERFWLDHAHGRTIPGQRAVTAALKAAGFSYSRPGGRTKFLV